MSQRLVLTEGTQMQIAPGTVSAKAREATCAALANESGIAEGHLALWRPNADTQPRQVLFVAFEPGTDLDLACEAILTNLGPIFDDDTRPDVVPVSSAALLAAVRELRSQVYPSVSHRPLLGREGLVAIVLSLLLLALWEWIRQR